MTYSSADIAQRIIAFALLPVFARELGPAEFGILGLAYTLTGFLGALLSLGISQAFIRFAPRHIGAARRLFLSGSWLFLVVFVTVAVGALAIVGPGFWGAIFEKLPYRPFVLLVLASALVNVAVLDVRLTLYRVDNKPASYVALTMTKLLLANGLSLVFVLAFDRGARGMIEGQTLAAVVVSVFALISLVREVGTSWSMPAAKESLRFGAPLAPRGIANWSLRMSDRVVLDRNVGLDEIGTYTVANQVSSSLQMLISGLGLALGPMIARTAETRNRVSALRPTLHRTVAALVTGGVVLCLLARPGVSVLLGAQYDAAENLLPWLFGGAIGAGLVSVLSLVLAFGDGKTGRIVVIALAGALLNLGLNLIVVPRYGAEGAAITTFCAYGAMAAATFLVQRSTGWVTERGFIPAVLLGAAVLIAGWLAGGQDIFVDGLIAGIAGLVLWPAIRVASGEPIDPRV